MDVQEALTFFSRHPKITRMLQTLRDVLHRLTDAGNTVIIIEHNLDVIKTALTGFSI